MSRIGKQPVSIPSGVEVKLQGRTFSVKGPLGRLERELHNEVELKLESGAVQVLPPSRPKQTAAIQGLTRTLVNNMVVGVSKGFTKDLDMEGVGYRAMVKGGNLEIHVGFSKPVEFPLPKGITAEVDKNNRITIKGIDKEQVGQTAANIRAIRPPEPYKGKGIRYAGERVRRKVGKAGVK